MLEGAFYGLDLLKLHSVTSKLVGRVDKLEEVSILGLPSFCWLSPLAHQTLIVFLQKARTPIRRKPLHSLERKNVGQTVAPNYAVLLVEYNTKTFLSTQTDRTALWLRSRVGP